MSTTLSIAADCRPDTDAAHFSFGYPISFLERRKLLEILYDALPDKTRVQVNKTVCSIDEHAGEGKGGVRVRTLDGEVYEGDIVVGADGVHSRTRSEMWRLSSTPGQAEIPTSDRSSRFPCHPETSGQ